MNRLSLFGAVATTSQLLFSFFYFLGQNLYSLKQSLLFSPIIKFGRNVFFSGQKSGVASFFDRVHLFL